MLEGTREIPAPPYMLHWLAALPHRTMTNKNTGRVTANPWWALRRIVTGHSGDRDRQPYSADGGMNEATSSLTRAGAVGVVNEKVFDLATAVAV